jgi:isovaleryl-CoA dehydrogenase
MENNTISALEADLEAVCSAIAHNAAAVDHNYAFPQESVSALARIGLLGMLVPTRLGGLDVDARQFAAFIQKIGGACASTGMILVMHSCAIETMRKFWPPADGVLAAAAKGQHLSTLACSERGTGANFYASFSSSNRQDDSFILNADKCFVTSGGHADSYIVSTQAVSSEGATDTTLYLLKREDSGMTFHGQWKGLGLRGNSSIALKLQDSKLSLDRMIGKQSQGLEIEMTCILPRFLLGTAAVYNGIAQAALEATLSHVKTRTLAHTGETLNMLPVLRSKLASMKNAIDSSVALMNVAADAFQSGESNALIPLLQAKQLSGRTAIDVTNCAMECCGGIAFSGALSIDRHFRDAQASVVMAPSNDILLDLIGRAALGMPLM